MGKRHEKSGAFGKAKKLKNKAVQKAMHTNVGRFAKKQGDKIKSNKMVQGALHSKIGNFATNLENKVNFLHGNDGQA